MTRVERTGQDSKPIHEQIYQEILRKIADGTYPPGTMLPTEKDLMAQYGVSRAPVRQALGRLEAQGAVLRRPGHGTVVVQVNPTAWASLSGFAQFYTENLEHVSGRLLGWVHLPAPETIAAPLGIRPGSMMTLLQRLRMVDGNPVAFMLNYIPTTVPTAELGDAFALSDLLRRHWNVNEEWAEESLWAVPADNETSHWLEVPVGAPVLKVARLSTDADRRPVAYSIYYVRSDRMTYRASLSRQQK